MNFTSILHSFVGRDSVVGIVTCNDFDGQDVESRWGVRFYASIQTVPFSNPAPYAMVTGSFQWVKRAGAWNLPPTAIYRRG
jgi:hypothetical protein